MGILPGKYIVAQEQSVRHDYILNRYADIKLHFHIYMIMVYSVLKQADLY
jgi:hypothetical protein